MGGPARRDSIVKCASFRFQQGDNRLSRSFLSVKKAVVQFTCCPGHACAHMVVSTGLGEQGVFGFHPNFE